MEIQIKIRRKLANTYLFVGLEYIRNRKTIKMRFHLSTQKSPSNTGRAQSKAPETMQIVLRMQ